MNNNFVYSYIRRICYLTGSILILLIGLLVAIVSNIPFKEVFKPVQLSYANSAASMYDSGIDYVETTLYNAKYTGYDCYKDGKKYASYYYCLVNNQCTFVLLECSEKKPLPEVLNQYTIKARLLENNNLSSKMKKEFSEYLGWNIDGLDKVSSNIYIDETAYHKHLYFFLMLFIGIIFIILFILLITNILYFAKPSLYPACRYFNMLEGTRSINHVNYEFNSKVLLKTGNITLTESYVIATSLFNIEILPINNIIWAYKHSTLHHFFGLPFNLTYNLNLVSKPHIYTYSPRNKKEDTDTVLSYFEEHYPNIIIGYSKENKQIVKGILKES